MNYDLDIHPSFHSTLYKIKSKKVWQLRMHLTSCPLTLVSVLQTCVCVLVCDCTHLCYSHQRAESCLAQLMLLPCRHWAYREPWRAEALQRGELSTAQGVFYSKTTHNNQQQSLWVTQSPLHSHCRAFTVFVLCLLFSSELDGVMKHRVFFFLSSHS